MENLGNIQILSRVSFLDKLFFTKHLSIMVKSGITVSEAIEILAAQTKSSKFHSVLQEVSKDIRNGQSLATALGRHKDVFNRFYISLIEVGEESGTIDENLKFLATHLAKEYALRKKIQGALLYPTIVLAAVFIVGIGMSLFVLPKLFNLFTSLNVELPITTKILLFFARVMKNHGILIVFGFIVFLFFLRVILLLPFIRLRWDSMKLSFPIFGDLLKNQELSNMCRNLGIMLKSGLPITKSLAVQYETSENLVFKSYIKNLQKSVDKGKALEEELNTGNYSNISPIAIKMIGVGEKTGQFDESFLYLGDFFEEEVDNTAKNLSVILEPLVLLTVGLIAGFVALSIISPIYELTGSINR